MSLLVRLKLTFGIFFFWTILCFYQRLVFFHLSVSLNKLAPSEAINLNAPHL